MVSHFAQQLEETRRIRIELLAAMIEASLHGKKKTRIMYEASINPRDFADFLFFLIEKGLLEEIRNEGEKEYRATEKGRSFLNSYREIVSTLD